MSGRSRSVRAGSALLVAAALVTGCTSNGGGQVTASSSLTVGGSALGASTGMASSSTPAAAASSTTTPSSSTATPSSRAVPSTARSQSHPTTSPGTKPNSARLATSTRVVTPTLKTAGLSANEIADREAIQAVWIKYWNVNSRIVRTPAVNRAALLKTVTVEPQLSNILEDAAKFQANGWDNYGIPGHDIYWGPAVGGKTAAIMGDCMDFSNVGKLVSRTSEKLTVGMSKQNFRGVFNLDTEGQWRVSAIEFLKGVRC